MCATPGAHAGATTSWRPSTWHAPTSHTPCAQVRRRTALPCPAKPCPGPCPWCCERALRRCCRGRRTQCLDLLKAMLNACRLRAQNGPLCPFMKARRTSHRSEPRPARTRSNPKPALPLMACSRAARVEDCGDQHPQDAGRAAPRADGHRHRVAGRPGWALLRTCPPAVPPSCEGAALACLGARIRCPRFSHPAAF